MGSFKNLGLSEQTLNVLKQKGFVKTETKGTRIIPGKEIYWKPENIYSRIGGNFG